MALTLAQRLKNPGLRSKLPASKLTPKLRAQRAQNARVARDNSNPLYDPTATLTGHALASAAKQLANAEIDPQEAALDQQSGQTRTQGAALISRGGDYYRQIAQQEAGGVARQAALGQLLQSQLAGSGQRAQQSLDAQNQAEQSREAQDASIRGVSTGSDQVAGELAALRGRATTQTQAAETQGAQTSAGWAGLQNALAGAMSLRGQEATSQLTNREANALDKLASQRASLEATRGPKQTAQLLNLRQQGFENIATTQGLGLKASGLAASVAKTKGDQRIAGQRIKSAAATNAANRASREKTAAAGQAVTKRGQDIAHQDRTAAQQAADAKRVQGVRAKASKAWANVENVLPQMNATVPLDAKGKPVTSRSTPVAGHRPATTQETLGALRAKKIPEWAIQAALDIRHKGALSQRTIDLIKRSAPDVRIPRKYLDQRPSTNAVASAPH